MNSKLLKIEINFKDHFIVHNAYIYRAKQNFRKFELFLKHILVKEIFRNLIIVYKFVYNIFYKINTF